MIAKQKQGNRKTFPRRLLIWLAAGGPMPSMGRDNALVAGA